MLGINKYLDKLAPKKARQLLYVILGFNCFVYWGGKIIAENKKHYGVDMPIDRKVPLIPWTVLIYVAAYVFWVVNYIMGCRYDYKKAKQFAYAEIAAKFVAFLFFIFLPTTMDRPTVTGDGFFCDLLRLIYACDAPTNLFPSLHCQMSWFSYIAVRGNSALPKAYRIFSAIFAMLVCMSTLTVKQHVILDTVPAVALAELSYRVTGMIMNRKTE